MQQLGPDHPRVKAVRVQIEPLQRQPPLSTDSDGPGLKLTGSRLEERRLLQHFGPDHPEVQKLRDPVCGMSSSYSGCTRPNGWNQSCGARWMPPRTKWIRLRGKHLCASCCNFGRRIPTCWSCKFEKRQLLKDLGPDHPQVKATAEQIERLLENAELLHSSRPPCSAAPTSESRSGGDGQWTWFTCLLVVRTQVPPRSR